MSGQLQAAKEDLVEMKNELAETIGINEMGQTDSTHKRNKRGLPIIAFGALTAATAGAGIACSLGSIFGMCGESRRHRFRSKSVRTKQTRVDRSNNKS